MSAQKSGSGMSEGEGSVQKPSAENDAFGIVAVSLRRPGAPLWAPSRCSGCLSCGAGVESSAP
jgi:hypothetical protein